jgi:hypothetical protein
MQNMEYRENMMQMQKKDSRFQMVLAVILTLEMLVLAGVVFYLAAGRDPGSSSALDLQYSESGKYVLYIGLNDKDTYDQLIPTGEAKAIVNDICVKYMDGYTVSESNGGWVDETGTLTEETTLVYTLSGADESDVIQMMDDVLEALNQNSILVERQDLRCTYYSGK